MQGNPGRNPIAKTRYSYPLWWAITSSRDSDTRLDLGDPLQLHPVLEAHGVSAKAKAVCLHRVERCREALGAHEKIDVLGRAGGTPDGDGEPTAV